MSGLFKFFLNDPQTTISGSLTGSGSILIPIGTLSVSLTGAGGTGGNDIWYDPGQPYIEPSGYHAGQPEIVASPGQPYIAASPGQPAISADPGQPYIAAYYDNPGQPYIAPTASSPGQPYIAPTSAQAAYYDNPGQPYIAPTGYHAEQAYIAPTAAQVYIAPYYANPGQPYIAPTGYHAEQVYIAANPGQPYIAPSGWVEPTLLSTNGHGRMISWEYTAEVYASWPDCYDTPGSTGPTNVVVSDWGNGGRPDDFLSWDCPLYSAGYYANPGQPYIAPTAGQPYIAAYYDNPGQPYIAPSGYHEAVPADPGQPYIAPTASSPGQAYIAPSGYHAEQLYIAPTAGQAYIAPTAGQPYIAAIVGQPYIAPYYDNPGQPYIAPSSGDGIYSGPSTTAILNGVTRTWAGGVGGAAQSSIQSLTSTGGGQTLSYSVGSGGSLSYSYQY